MCLSELLSELYALHSATYEFNTPRSDLKILRHFYTELNSRNNLFLPRDFGKVIDFSCQDREEKSLVEESSPKDSDQTTRNILLVPESDPEFVSRGR